MAAPFKFGMGWIVLHPAYYNWCNYLYTLVLKLIHVSKKGPISFAPTRRFSLLIGDGIYTKSDTGHHCVQRCPSGVSQRQAQCCTSTFDVFLLKCFWISIITFQWTHYVIITTSLRQNDVATSFWRYNDVIITSCVTNSPLIRSNECEDRDGARTFNGWIQTINIIHKLA